MCHLSGHVNNVGSLKVWCQIWLMSLAPVGLTHCVYDRYYNTEVERKILENGQLITNEAAGKLKIIH